MAPETVNLSKAEIILLPAKKKGPPAAGTPKLCLSFGCTPCTASATTHRMSVDWKSVALHDICVSPHACYSLCASIEACLLIFCSSSVGVSGAMNTCPCIVELSVLRVE